MKGIVCLILVALTWGESLDMYWNLMRDGQYGEAVAKIEKYLNEGRRVSETERIEGERLMQKAQVCQEMKERAQSIDIVDSIKVKKVNMLSVCEMVMGGSKVSMKADGGAEFVATRGDKRLMSVKGAGGYDIYRQFGEGAKEKLSDVINTDVNENYPYEMSDGVTLYFASEGHGSIGGYDLFMARYNSETFDYSRPQNIGMPFNTLGNEYLMMVDDIAGLGLWVTDWKQNGDTVIAYVYKLEDSEENQRHVGEALETVSDIMEDASDEEKMEFVVKDGLVYNRIENFRSLEARAEYIEMKELQKEVRLVELLLEDKRMTFSNSSSEDERKSLSKDIVDDEKYLMEAKKRLNEMAKDIRQLEMKQYE